MSQWIRGFISSCLLALLETPYPRSKRATSQGRLSGGRTPRILCDAFPSRAMLAPRKGCRDLSPMLCNLTFQGWDSVNSHGIPLRCCRAGFEKSAPQCLHCAFHAKSRLKIRPETTKAPALREVAQRPRCRLCLQPRAFIAVLSRE